MLHNNVDQKTTPYIKPKPFKGPFLVRGVSPGDFQIKFSKKFKIKAKLTILRGFIKNFG